VFVFVFVFVFVYMVMAAVVVVEMNRTKIFSNMLYTLNDTQCFVVVALNNESFSTEFVHPVAARKKGRASRMSVQQKAT